jgi:hypothetical protein
MNVGAVISVGGCVTKEKFLAGRTLAEIEKALGFHSGRLAAGMTVVALTQLPDMHEFELAAYSNVATHRFSMPSGLEIQKIKAQARATFQVTGPDRLVKVIAATSHDPNMDPDIQYPPGQGAPQWVMKAKLQGKVVAVVSGYPSARYLAADAARRW